MELFGDDIGILGGLIVVITITTGLMLSFKIYQKFKGERPDTADEIIIGKYTGEKNIDLALLSKNIQDVLYLQEFRAITSYTSHESEFEERITAHTTGFGQSSTVKIIITGKPNNFSVMGDFGSMKSATHHSISMVGSATEKKSLRSKNHIIESIKCMINLSQYSPIHHN